mgnify:FL=1
MYRTSITAAFKNLALGIAGLSLVSFSPASAQQSQVPSQSLPSENVSLRKEVQHAVSKGVAWLRSHQDPKGFWSTPDHPAITALALVALVEEPGVQDRPLDSEAVKKGYAYLLSCAKPDGGIYVKDLLNYNTAVSMMALLAANRPEDKPLLLKARQFLIGLQADFNERGKVDNPFDGGIGYGSKEKHSDMANTLQALEALYYSRHLAADENLADRRDLNWPAVIHFIQSCQNLPTHNSERWASGDPQNKGGFIYYPGHSMAGETNLPGGRVALRSYGSISYAGLLSYIYAHLQREDPRVQAVVNWLRGNFTLEENPGLGAQGLFYYYYTLTKALTIYGADYVETTDGRKIKWREDVAVKLINLQDKDGFWVNANGRWWEKDPVLVTAYMAITLEIMQRRL